MSIVGFSSFTSPSVIDQLGSNDSDDLVSRLKRAEQDYDNAAVNKQKAVGAQIGVETDLAKKKSIEYDRVLSGERDENNRFRTQTEKDFSADPLKQIKPWDPNSVKKTTPLEDFGSAAFVFAMLGSALTRQPMQNALNAGAAALNARKAGNDAAYQEAYETWKTNKDLALEKHKMMLDDYAVSKDLHKENIQQWETELRLTAMKWQDQSMLAALNAKRPDLAMEIAEKRIALTEKVEKASQEIELGHQKQEEIKRERTAVEEARKAAASEGRPFTAADEAAAIGNVRSRLTAGGTNALKYSKPQEIEVRNEKGEITKVNAQQNQQTLQWVTSDERKLPIAPESIVNVKVSSGESGREAIYTNRMLTSASEAIAGVKNIVNLPSNTTSSFFGQGENVSLLGATKEYLKGTINSDEQQMYKTAMTGIARNLASIEAVGLLPTNSLTNKIESGVLLDPSDKQLNRLSKIAEMRQIIEYGLTPILSNPRVPEETKENIRKLIDETKEAVPFTPNDVIHLMESKDPKATIKDFAESALFKPKGPGIEIPEAYKENFKGYKDGDRVPDGKGNEKIYYQGKLYDK